MSGLQFLTTSDVMALHEQVMAASDQLATALVRREALESAVHSARNLAWYSGAAASEIAPHLAIHIALAHPWVDGNKRTGAMAGILIARLNGARQATPDEALEFGQLLIQYIEATQTVRDAIFAEFVQFVGWWFN